MWKFPIMCLFVLAVAAGARAGEEQESLNPIPSRVAKAAVGDWVQFSIGDDMFRHRVEKVERNGGDIVVSFAFEALDAAGKVVKTDMGSVTASKESEVNRRYMAAFDENHAFGYSDTVLVGDKPVTAMIFIDPRTQSEFWFSDAMGVFNLIRFDPGQGETAKRRLTVDFGTAADAPPGEKAN